MNEYILWYSDPGPAPESDRATICNFPGVRVAEDGGRSLLVTSSAAAVARLVSQLAGWKMAPNQTSYFVPSPVPTIRQAVAE